MKVFKFGGGVLTKPESLIILSNILNNFPNDRLILVISAFGKTTNKLEEIIDKVKNSENFNFEFNNLKQYYFSFLEQYFPSNKDDIYHKIDKLFQELRYRLDKYSHTEEDMLYDQIISYGEIMSSIIVSEYLKVVGLLNKWLDARKCLLTNNVYRNAEIIEETTIRRVRIDISLDLNHRIFVIQGFIGGNEENKVTTLGREGSDYTAAIVASAIGVESVVFWKDVDGIYSSDPHHFNDAKKINELTYDQTLEMTEMGSKVLHPKTIKPLKENEIPIEVKKFAIPIVEGTKIHLNAIQDNSIPIITNRREQILLTILQKNETDFDTDQRKTLSKLFYKSGLTISFLKFYNNKINICFGYNDDKVKSLIIELNKDFKVFYTKNLVLTTVINSNTDIINKLSANKRIMHIEKIDNKAYILFDQSF